MKKPGLRYVAMLLCLGLMIALIANDARAQKRIPSTATARFRIVEQMQVGQVQGRASVASLTLRTAAEYVADELMTEEYDTDEPVRASDGQPINGNRENAPSRWEQDAIIMSITNARAHYPGQDRHPLILFVLTGN